MVIMIIGLILFLGIHLVPVAPGLRGSMVTALGYDKYRAAFAAVAALGLVLIIAGYWMRPEDVQLFAPFPQARAVASVLVPIAFVLFAAANMKAHIRKLMQHPMLIGLLLWSGVHLLSNGDLAGTVLFGSFLAYSVIDLASAFHRHAVKPFEPRWSHDVIAIVAGVVLAWITVLIHPWLFGTGPVA